MDKKQKPVLLIPGGYANWLNGQPNNHQRYQTCAAIEVDDRYSFNDIKCMERMGTICEIPGGEYMERMGTICQIPGGECMERMGTICQIPGGEYIRYLGESTSDTWGRVHQVPGGEYIRYLGVSTSDTWG